jgi:hypothetical protein
MTAEPTSDEMTTAISELSDDDLVRELSIAESVPDAAPPASERWLRLLRTERASRVQSSAVGSWHRAGGDLFTATQALVACLVREYYPDAAVVVTEGFPADEIGGNDGLSLCAVQDADGRVLADKGTPDERFDELTDGLHEHLGTLIDLEPELFHWAQWPLP